MTTEGPLLLPDRLPEVRDLLAAEDLGGWLLYDFRDQNPIAHRLLGLGKTTRRSFTLISRDRDPLVLRHVIEASAWRHLPWEQRDYSDWRSLERGLSEVLDGVGTVAMEHSPSNAVPSVDRVPAGVVELVRGLGAEVRSSGDLVSAFHSRWTAEGLALHRRAAEAIRSIAIGAFRRAADGVRDGAPPREAELMGWIVGRMHEEGLTHGADCIVAAGVRSADPHYMPEGPGEAVKAGDVVLIDLWGRHPGPGVFADQTWMGVLAPNVPDRVATVWAAVRKARDRALALLTEAAVRGRDLRGFEVDRAARSVLVEHELAGAFTHRLGHSIDRDLHGSGPDLDDLETRDVRRLLPGVGFSVEPGVYLAGEFGIRSEVNVHWAPGAAEVTPGEIQRELLLMPPR